MAAEAALRSGVGLVTVASAKSAIPMMAPRLPEAMWEPLPETDSGVGLDKASSQPPRAPSRTHRPRPRTRARHGRRDRCSRRRDRGRLGIPTVVDADGLNALARKRVRIPAGRALALTPHPGEAGRLLGSSAQEIESGPPPSGAPARRGDEDPRASEGLPDSGLGPEGNVQVNLTGNAGMATGGTGDVLTGIVGALLAQGLGHRGRSSSGSPRPRPRRRPGRGRDRTDFPRRDRPHREASRRVSEAGGGLTETVAETDSAEKTFASAFELGPPSSGSSFYYLHGDLGAGKTLFTKGHRVLPRHRCEPSHEPDVRARARATAAGRECFYHIDLYRIENERELAELGIEEMEEEGAVLVVEWAEKLGRRRREDAIDVTSRGQGRESDGGSRYGAHETRGNHRGDSDALPRGRDAESRRARVEREAMERHLARRLHRSRNDRGVRVAHARREEAGARESARGDAPEKIFLAGTGAESTSETLSRSRAGRGARRRLRHRGDSPLQPARVRAASLSSSTTIGSRTRASNSRRRLPYPRLHRAHPRARDGRADRRSIPTSPESRTARATSSRLQETKRVCPEEFAVLTGSAQILLAAFTVGASGAILADACAAWEESAELEEALAAGEIDRARAIQTRLARFSREVVAKRGFPE